MSLTVNNPFAPSENNSGGNVNVPDGSVVQKGVVQLSNAIDSQSQSYAATSKAVYDAIQDANTYTDNLFAQINIVHDDSNTTPPNTFMLWKK